MDILNQMIAVMDRKEVKSFKVYLKRALDKTDRKDLSLFEYIRKAGDNYEEEKIINRLYNASEKGAFYRLKNRLAEDIGISVFEQKYLEDNTMHGFYLVSMAHYYTSKSNFRLAIYFLRKAEKKAKQIENYSLLEIIYGNLIRSTREVLNENPEKYIQKRRENRALLNKMGEMDDILESIEYKMMISQNLTGSRQEILNILKETINRYTLDEELKDSSRLQFGVYFIVSRIFLQNNDYDSLEKYLVDTYTDFQKKNLFNKTNHSHKLQMLSWIANALFVNKKYSLSLNYAEELKKEMERFDGQFYSRYELFYYNSLVINFSVINPAKAIVVLQELLQKEKSNKLTFSGVGVFVYMNLAMLYYTQKNYTKALQSLNKLYNYEGYASADPRLKLKMNIGELMMRYDRNEIEILEYRLKQIQKEFSAILNNDTSEMWEGSFLHIIGQLATDLKVRDLKKVQFTAKALINNMKENSSSYDMLFAYDKWLAEKAKIDL